MDAEFLESVVFGVVLLVVCSLILVFFEWITNKYLERRRARRSDKTRSNKTKRVPPFF